jgi:hypothetical protein
MLSPRLGYFYRLFWWLGVEENHMYQFLMWNKIEIFHLCYMGM